MDRPYNDLAILRRLARQARPYRAHLGGILGLSLLAPPLALLMPLPLKIAVDSVIGSEPLPRFLRGVVPAAAERSDMSLLLLAVFLMIAIALLLHLQGLASWVLQTYTGEKLALDFRTRLVGHVQRLSFSYHDTRGITDSIYRIQYDAPAIQWILINGFLPLLTAGLTLFGMIYVASLLDWQLALVALVVTPVLFLLARALRDRLRGRWYEIKQQQSSAMSAVQEALAAARVVRAFGQEQREEERFVRHASRGMQGQVHLAFLEGWFELLVGVTLGIGTAVALYIGVVHVRSGVLTLGELLIIMAYLGQIYTPLETLTKNFVSLQSNLAGAERAFALLDEIPDVVERPDARSLERARGAVSFRNVSFSYDARHPVLDGISFEMEAGRRVGIVGRTGAGKTTLISLLMRFYDPTAGEVLLDGMDVRDYRIADLRNQFAIVLQEPVLLSTTIAENIAYGRPGARAEEVVEAAKQANAHDFIMSLPEQYDTQAGERGMSMSGGERQRIALARAFLKDAPILILDEPTSSVDVRTEAGILEAMERLMSGRTTFIIAHRTSALKHCDVMVEMEEGQVVAITSPAPGSVGGALIL